MSKEFFNRQDIYTAQTNLLKSIIGVALAHKETVPDVVIEQNVRYNALFTIISHYMVMVEGKNASQIRKSLEAIVAHGFELMTHHDKLAYGSTALNEKQAHLVYDDFDHFHRIFTKILTKLQEHEQEDEAVISDLTIYCLDRMKNDVEVERLLKYLDERVNANSFWRVIKKTLELNGFVPNNRRVKPVVEYGDASAV